MQLGRVYDVSHDGSLRVLVDRLWPRGFRRDDPRIGRWLPAVAPSNELRRWYGHDPARFDEFADRYRQELGGGAEAAAFTELADLVAHRDVTLITATREVDRSHLAVLARLLDADPDAMTEESADLTRIRRWADAGGTWRVVARRPDGVIVSLCRCDGGEEADRFVTADPPTLAYLADRDSNEQ